jgi:hypothetical protein
MAWLLAFAKIAHEKGSKKNTLLDMPDSAPSTTQTIQLTKEFAQSRALSLAHTSTLQPLCTQAIK